MPLLPRAALQMCHCNAIADADTPFGATPLPARPFALALAASLALHLLLVAGLEWSDTWWPAGDPGASAGGAETVPLIVDLSVAGADDRVSFRVRPAIAIGAPNGTGTPPESSTSPGRSRKAAASATPLLTPIGVVTVAQSNDIGFVDSALAKKVAAEFRAPATERPQLEDDLVVVYPGAALPERRQMQVGVLVVVGESGQIESTKKSFEDTLFAPRIDAALQSARFAPAMRDGRPVRYWTVLVFHFEVQGAPKSP